MGIGDHLDPLVHGDPARGYDVAQFLVQDLGGGAGQAAHAGILQTLKVFPNGALGPDRTVKHFFRGETMDVHVGELFGDSLAQTDVEVAFHLGRQTRLHAHLGGSVGLGFPGAPDDLVHGQEIAFLLPEIAAEGAETAPLDAHVGEVDVPVDHVGHQVAYRAAAQFVGHQGHGSEFRARGGEQDVGLFDGDVAAGQGIFQHGRHVRAQRIDQGNQGCGSVAVSCCGHSVEFPLSRIRTRR